MALENISQYGPLSAAYMAGAGSAWGFIMKWLLPRELKALNVQIENLRGKVDEMKPEVDEYRRLKSEALKDKLHDMGAIDAERRRLKQSERE